MFRPCIDLHEGKVKQIVGGTLNGQPDHLQTNFVSERSSAWYAQLYRQDNLQGGHVIMLGPGNEPAALAALAAFPGGLQVGGGIRPENAARYLDAGASHVIVTSFLFPEARLHWGRLTTMSRTVGKQRLVVDLSCRWREGEHWVVTDRWQTFTDTRVRGETLERLAQHCAEFLVHAADREGLCHGIDHSLVERLGHWSPIPLTYAGGARSLSDLETVTRLGQGRVDLTIGSALDIFGGNQVRYADAVAFNQTHTRRKSTA